MKTAAILLRSPRAFPLSVWATFKRQIQMFTHKFTPLSIYSTSIYFIRVYTLYYIYFILLYDILSLVGLQKLNAVLNIACGNVRAA